MTVYSAGHVFGKKVEISASGKYAILQSAPVVHPLALHVVNVEQLNELNQDSVCKIFTRELETLVEKYIFLGIEHWEVALLTERQVMNLLVDDKPQVTQSDLAQF